MPKLHKNEKEQLFRDRVQDVLGADNETWTDGWLWTIIPQASDCGRDLSELTDELQEIENQCKMAKEALMRAQNYFNDVRSDEPFKTVLGRDLTVRRKGLLDA